MKTEPKLNVVIEPVVVRVKDVNKLHCFQRLNEFDAKPFTKFIMTKPAFSNGRWEMRSYVNYELAESDADVVVLLKKGLTVRQGTLALWSVSKMLLKAEKEALKNKNRIAAIAAKKAGGVKELLFRAKSVAAMILKSANKLFNLPVSLYHTIRIFLSKRGL